MSDGGITVSKVTTGVFLIEDIKVNVPHKEPVYIPGNKAVNSTDLHRALNARILFQLVSTLPTQVASPSSDPERFDAVEAENRTLREALERSSQQGAALQRSLESVEGKLGTLMAVVEKMASAPVQVVSAGVRAVQEPLSEVVGGEVPMFIPSEIVPKDADMHVETTAEVSKNDSVSAAAAKLRELRRRG